MYSCHRKLGHIIDTGCRERGFREVSRGPAVCVGTNSNGDTLPFLGHYGCHCIIQVVEEIPKTCASCESWRKHLYKCIRFVTKSDWPFTVVLCFQPFILWASLQRCICWHWNFFSNSKVWWESFARASVGTETRKCNSRCWYSRCCFQTVALSTAANHRHLCQEHKSTQAHWKYVSLHTFLQQRNYVPCSTFRGSFKVKCPESGAKTHV